VNPPRTPVMGFGKVYIYKFATHIYSIHFSNIMPIMDKHPQLGLSLDPTSFLK